MKKTVSVIILALLISTGTLFAQKSLYFGLGGSFLSSAIINQNNYGLDFEMDYDVTLGGSGNATIGFDFNKHLGLKMEIAYAKLGQDYSDNFDDTLYTRKIKLNYLQIPLMFKFRTSGEVARFYVAAGPQFNLLLSASQEYLKGGLVYDTLINRFEWTEPQVVGENTITDRYNSLDVLGRLDLGVDISLTENLFLNLGLTMAYGFLDINATDWQIADYSSGEYNPSHNVYGGMNIGLNYRLPVGKAK